MKSPLVLFLLLSLVSIIFSFVPMPTDPSLLAKCTSTGGSINESYSAHDCGAGCTAQPETISDCACPNGKTYSDIKRIVNFSGCNGSPSVPPEQNANSSATPQKTLCNSSADCSGVLCINGACAPSSVPAANNASSCAPALVLSLLVMSTSFFSRRKA